MAGKHSKNVMGKHCKIENSRTEKKYGKHFAEIAYTASKSATIRKKRVSQKRYKNLKVNLNIKLLPITVIVIMIALLCLLSTTNAKYVLQRELLVPVNTAGYYFTAKTEKEEYVSDEDGKIEAVIELENYIELENTQEKMITEIEVEYTIEAKNEKDELENDKYSNDKYEIEIRKEEEIIEEGKLAKEIEQKERITIIAIPKEDAEIEEEETINIIVTTTKPYEKENKIEIKILKPHYKNVNNNEYYGTLKQVLNEAETGTTIQVMKNKIEKETAIMPSDKTLTIDINNKNIEFVDNALLNNNGTLSLTGSGNLIGSSSKNLINNNGTLTIAMDNSNGNIENMETSENDVINNKGTLNIISGNIENKKLGWNIVYSMNEGNVLMKGGTLKASGGIENVGNGLVKVTGGTINADINAIRSTSSGEIIIGDNEIETPINIEGNGHGVYATTTSTANITINKGIIVSGISNTINNQGKAKVIINGGNIISNGATAIAQVLPETQTIINGNAQITGARKGIENTNGKIIINSGKIVGQQGIVVWDNGTVDMTGGEIKGETLEGIKLDTTTNGARVTVTGGIVEGINYAIANEGQNCEVIIGDEETEVSKTNPKLKAQNNNVILATNNTSTFKYYSGELKGTTKIAYNIAGTTIIRRGYTAETTQEVDEDGFYKTILNPIEIIVKELKEEYVSNEDGIAQIKINLSNYDEDKIIEEDIEYIVEAENEKYNIEINKNDTEVSGGTLPKNIATSDIIKINVTPKENVEIEEEETIQIRIITLDPIEETKNINIKILKPYYKNEITEEYYETLNQALNEAETGTTIQAIKNKIENETVIIPNNKTLTIDINNKNIEFAENALLTNNGTLSLIGSGILKGSSSKNPIDNKGILTIAMDNINGKIENVETSENDVIKNEGMLNIVSGNVENKNIKGSIVYCINDGNVLMSDGILKATVGIKNYGNGLIKITGGTIIGQEQGVTNWSAGNIIIGDNEIETQINIEGTTGIYNWDTGTVTINRGNIKGTNGHAINARGTGDIIINGGKIETETESAIDKSCYDITTDKPNPTGAGNIRVTGGEIIGINAGINIEGEGNIEITGGEIKGQEQGIIIWKNGIVEMTGGKIIGENIDGIKFDENADGGYVIVTGGEIEGHNFAIQVTGENCEAIIGDENTEVNANNPILKAETNYAIRNVKASSNIRYYNGIMMTKINIGYDNTENITKRTGYTVTTTTTVNAEGYYITQLI